MENAKVKEKCKKRQQRVLRRDLNEKVIEEIQHAEGRLFSKDRGGSSQEKHVELN